MMRRGNKQTSIALSAITLLCLSCSAPKATENQNGNVIVAGEMRRVMQMGDLSASISLDTIQSKEHLYGIGPLDSLKGEITVLDGKAYYSTLLDGKMLVTESYGVKAPFFVYSNVTSWDELPLPDSVRTDVDLDEFITLIAKNRQLPFAFRLTTTIDSANIHVVNLPSGTVITFPQDTHKGQADFTLEDTDVEIIGFFSTSHKGVFTHHDSNTHMHLVTADRRSMGHVDQLLFRPSTTLYIQN